MADADKKELGRLLTRRWDDFNWPGAAGLARFIAALVTVAIALFWLCYALWPSIDVQASPDKLSTNPNFAWFDFSNTGRLCVEDLVISCDVDGRHGKHNHFEGGLVNEGLGYIGSVVAQLCPKQPPIQRQCAPIIEGQQHPSTIMINVWWHGLSVRHQYFISRQISGSLFKMVPESDPLTAEAQ